MFKYLKEKGLKRTVEVLWIYKIEIMLEKAFLIFLKRKPLKNIIIIESHDDFDSNGGAFYDYLIENKYNEKYKIVWLVRRRYNKKLPKNVTTVRLFGPSMRKAYYACMAKYMLFDSDMISKRRDGQVLVYCSHGCCGGLKAVKGKLIIPDDIDYILMSSKEYTPISAPQLSLSPDDRRLVYIGYPRHDLLYKNKGDRSEIKKISRKEYKKVILWMPTFRKSIAFDRNDSSKEQKYGIPLIDNMEKYQKLNKCLLENNVLLVIKIHPKQDLNSLMLPDTKNIRFIKPQDVKKLNIENMRLMCSADALVSDYSSVSNEFLHLDRPLAYAIDDERDYKIGFVVEDIRTLMAGQEIHTIDDFCNFIVDVSSGKDRYKERRRRLRNLFYNHLDGKACERLARLLKL